MQGVQGPKILMPLLMPLFTACFLKILINKKIRFKNNKKILINNKNCDMVRKRGKEKKKAGIVINDENCSTNFRKKNAWKREKQDG